MMRARKKTSAGLKAAAAFLPCLCAAISLPAGASGQGSTNFTMPLDTFNSGTGTMNSANYRAVSSLGDAIAGGAITSVSFQIRGGFRAQLNATQAVLNLLTVASRKMHGATPFSLAIDHSQPISGAITVESRAIGSGHTLVFHFDGNVNFVGAVAALDAMMNSAGTATSVRSGNDVIVTLTGVSDNSRLTITLNEINGVGTASASLGFLVGDVNNSRSVNATDISGVKARSGQATDAGNFRFDLNASGGINATDISAVKARSGLVIP